MSHDPRASILAALCLVLCCVSTPDHAYLAFAGYAVIALGLILAARIPPRTVALRLSVVGMFCLLAAVGPLWPAGEGVDWSRAVAAIAKALISATTLIWLVTSTGFPGVLAGLDRLRVPRFFITLIGTTYRYAFLLVDEARRMRRAALSRGYHGRWLGQARILGGLIAHLFLRSYERGERVHAAMLCRGYTGRTPVAAGADAAWSRGDGILLTTVAGAALLLRVAA